MPARAIHCNSQSELLASLFDRNCNRNGHTDHGVGACAEIETTLYRLHVGAFFLYIEYLTHHALYLNAPAQ